MSDLVCEYHPHRTAIDKCTRCHRLICLQDKTTYTTPINQYNSTQTYYASTVLCPLCYYTATQESRKFLDKSKQGFSVFIIVALLMIIFFFIMVARSISDFNNRASDAGFDNQESPMDQLLLPFLGFIAFLGIAGLLFTKFFKSSEEKLDTISEKAATQKTEFLETIKDPSIREKYEGVKFTCFQCGNVLSERDKFCLNCGDSTRDERKAHGLASL